MSAARLRFEVGGGRSMVARQHVPYPFHVTRPFYFDDGRPDIATLYLQSSSGGLYSGEDLTLGLEVGAGAAVHVTTQASTVVHDGRGRPTRSLVDIEIGDGGFLAYTPDPMILLPGAGLESEVAVTLAPGARGLVADGVLAHDPRGGVAMFDRLVTACRIRDGYGRLLLQDRQVVEGSLSPAALGGYRCLGNAVIFGPDSLALDAAGLEGALDSVGCLAGVSALPGELGLGIRLLAADGDSFRRGLDLIFAAAFGALIGQAPGRRRK